MSEQGSVVFVDFAGSSSKDGAMAFGGGGPGGPEKPASGLPNEALAERVSNLSKLFWVLAAAFGAAFLFFLSRIDEQFNRLDAPLRDVEKGVAAQSATLNSIQSKLDSIDQRLENRNDNSSSKRAD